MQRLLRALQTALLTAIAILCCRSGAQARSLRSSGGGPVAPTGAELVAAPHALGNGAGRHLLGSGYVDSWSSRELPAPRTDVAPYSSRGASPAPPSFGYQSNTVPSGRMNGPIMDGGAGSFGRPAPGGGSSSSGWGGYPQPYGGRR